MFSVSLRSEDDFHPLFKSQETTRFTSKLLDPLHGRINPRSAPSNKHMWKILIPISDTISCPLKNSVFDESFENLAPMSQWNRPQKNSLWLKGGFAFNIFLFCHLCSPVMEPEQLLFERRTTSSSLFFQISSLEMHKYRTDSLDEVWLNCVVFVLSPLEYSITKQRTTAVPISLHVTVINNSSTGDSQSRQTIVSKIKHFWWFQTFFRFNAESLYSFLSLRHTGIRRHVTFERRMWRNICYHVHFAGWRCNLNGDKCTE